MGRIGKNYVYNLAYQIIVLLAPIVTAPYLARVVGAERLGIYSFVSSSGNIIITLSLLGIYSYGCRQTAYVRDQKQLLTQTFWEIMAARLLLTVLGTAIYAVFILLNRDTARFLLLYYPYLLANFLDCSWVYVGLEDMLPAVMKNILVKLLTVAGIFLLVKGPGDLWIYILLIAGATLLGNVLVYFQLPKYVGLSRPELHSFPVHIRGSLRLFFPQAAYMFYLQVDKVMLKWLTGTTAQVSYYDQAEKIIMIPLTAVTVISTVMMPRIANEFQKGNRDEIERLLLRAGRFALFLACPMMVGLFVVARQFVPWYLGPAFLPTATAMMVLSPIVVLNSMTGISGSQYFTATDQISVLFKAYGAAALINVVVNALLIPRFGYLGAAIATVLSAAISAVVQYRTLSRQIRLRPLGIDLLRKLSASVVFGGILWAVSRTWPASIRTTAAQIGIGILLWIVMMLLLRDPALRIAIRTLREIHIRRKRS